MLLFTTPPITRVAVGKMAARVVALVSSTQEQPLVAAQG
jgi:hypothetical protein